MINHYSKKRKVKLIGHSWGAMLATEYIGKFPEKVSQAVLVEPGMLHPKAAQEFVRRIKEAQSLSDGFALVRYLFVFPFVKRYDDHEGYDYVMTQLFNRSELGSPFQCPGAAMPPQSFKRSGYKAFATMTGYG